MWQWCNQWRRVADTELCLICRRKLNLTSHTSNRECYRGLGLGSLPTPQQFHTKSLIFPKHIFMIWPSVHNLLQHCFFKAGSRTNHCGKCMNERTWSEGWYVKSTTITTTTKNKYNHNHIHVILLWAWKYQSPRAEPKSASLLSGITDLRQKKKNNNHVWGKMECFWWRKQKLSDSAGKAVEMMALESFMCTHTPTGYFSVSLSSVNIEDTHACSDTRASTCARTHANTHTRNWRACTQSFMQQIVNLKDQSWVPHHISPVMRNRYGHPLFCMHTHPLTQVSNIYPDWRLARTYMLYFTKWPDQRLNTGPVEICYPGRSVSSVTTDVPWITFA